MLCHVNDVVTGAAGEAICQSERESRRRCVRCAISGARGRITGRLLHWMAHDKEWPQRSFIWRLWSAAAVAILMAWDGALLVDSYIADEAACINGSFAISMTEIKEAHGMLPAVK